MQLKSPAYRWYPRDVLGSVKVAAMSAAQECWYRRALDFSWLNIGIPSDPKKLARVIGKGCTIQGAEIVLTMFVKTADPNLMVSERQEFERQKQKEWSDKSAEGGRKSRPSKSSQDQSKDEPPFEAKAKQNGTLQVASSVCNDSPNGKSEGAGEAADPIHERIWKDGRDLLVRSGLSQSMAGSFLGNMAKTHGKEDLAAAIAVTQAANPADPKGYIVAVLQKRGNAGAYVGKSKEADVSENLPDCDQCKNERFVKSEVNPDSQYDWARYVMTPCPNCSPGATT